MAARVVVRGGVPVGRVITAADVAALQADAQVQPDAAFPQAILAAGDAVRELKDLDRAEVGTGSRSLNDTRVGLTPGDSWAAGRAR